MKYFLGLGSNLGDPEKNLARGVSRLKKKGLKILASSSVYRTEPLGFAGQPWFLNQVIEVEANCSPWELLEMTKSIEKKMGRRSTFLNGPRIIDIDILLAEETIVQTENLSVPHLRLAERNFVLVPLGEIARRAVHPVLKKTIKDLLRCSTDRARVFLYRKQIRRRNERPDL
jgi:2-amino-4-hydroxy-6-hydroxymethyldihydropteridine diphosphokinase